MILQAILVAALLALAAAAPTALPPLNSGVTMAGAAMVNGSLPVGVPLAGYNHAQRRVPDWPIPKYGPYTTWMMPSVGIMDPTWVKALIISDGAGNTFVSVTIDAIGADNSLNFMAYAIAQGMGFDIPFENIVFSSSHTHSGPGGIGVALLWTLAPAIDAVVPELQQLLATSVAEALMEARRGMQPAVVAIGNVSLIGVTQNRRGHYPGLNPGDIDPNLGLIRVDSLTGKPIATLWNFAIHGVCYGPDNMLASGDIMGKACELITNATGAPALFVNADAGDIDPGPGMCNNAPTFVGSQLMAQAVLTGRAGLAPSVSLSIELASAYVPFGPTDLNVTLSRFSNCTSGGPMDVCTLCAAVRCDLNSHMPGSWIENTPRFTAFRFESGNQSTVAVSLPGEPLVELGWWVRNDTQLLGFDRTFLFGYSNSHMGYFATPDQYDLGGYESDLTFWGITTAAQIRKAAYGVTSTVAPPKRLRSQ